VVGNTLNTHLSSLDLHWTWDRDALSGIGESSQNVWKRAYRREHDRKKNKTAAAAAGGAYCELADEVAGDKIELAFRISIEHGVGEVLVEWLRGSDQVLWESFCGMLHRVFKKG
jgi:23S rRNA (adenine1618-N6)-methyltransferase